MSSEAIVPERQFKTPVVLRHGLFAANEQSDLTGDAAQAVVDAGRRRDDYDDWPLLPEGEAQAARAADRFASVRLGGAALKLDACFCSPPLRTRQTAQIFLDRLGVTLEIMEAPELRERDRDIFSYNPDEWSKAHPLYPKDQPLLTRRFAGGETILEVLEREQPLLAKADKVTPGGAVLFVAHAESTFALRVEPTLGGLIEEQSEQPYMPNPPPGIRPLQTSAWIASAQLDIHTRQNPFTGEVGPRMTHFRAVADAFDSGWVENWRMRRLG